MYGFDSKLWRQQLRLASEIQQIATAAPQVAALRLARMAGAGASPSARDQKELNIMWTEKARVFSQAWLAVWQQAIRLQQQWALQTAQLVMQSMLSGKAPSQAQLNRLFSTWNSTAWRARTAMSADGLAAVRRRVTANAKRLGRPR